MATYGYNLRLTSDAEPGTGLGGEVLNELIPRDHLRRPIIPASHIKGLLRAALRDMTERLGWDDELVTRVCGGHERAEDDADIEFESAFHLTPARAEQPVDTALVTRTAVDEDSGGAREATLRTTEAIPVGTVFRGAVHFTAVPGSPEDLAWRLGLLSIPAVGGSRNRGCGACVAEIDGESRTPGQLLRELDQSMAREPWQNAPSDRRFPRGAASSASVRLSENAVVLRLVYRALTPICCPELPDKTNVISTGFSIPASAVQGAILSRLNAADPALATALFDSPVFRAWPLQPCWLPRPGDDPPAAPPTAVRVSLTHRVAKLSLPGNFDARLVFDEAIDGAPYDWTRVGDGAPLKAADGVLLRFADRGVLLWKAAEMPHAVSAHGVHGESPEERNLFTVDAMAPLLWQGLVVLPEDAAERLQASLAQEPLVPLGKSRSVRGLGELRGARVADLPDEWRTPVGHEHTVLVVQSPLLLPDLPPAGQTAEEEFHGLVAAWAGRHGLPAPVSGRTWANVGLRFGWNRHGAGRQRACRVILPGSVVAFPGRLDDMQLAAAIRQGVGGDGRVRGFGAVSVHPGKAVGLYPDVKPQPTVKDGALPRRNAVRLVLDMARGAARLPSPSQIRAVQERLRAGRPAALEYLQRQTERTSRIWFTWEPIHDAMSALLKDFDPPVAAEALQVLANLAIVTDKREARS